MRRAADMRMADKEEDLIESFNRLKDSVDQKENKLRTLERAFHRPIRPHKNLVADLGPLATRKPWQLGDFRLSATSRMRMRIRMYGVTRDL